MLTTVIQDEHLARDLFTAMYEYRASGDMLFGHHSLERTLLRHLDCPKSWRSSWSFKVSSFFSVVPSLRNMLRLHTITVNYKRARGGSGRQHNSLFLRHTCRSPYPIRRTPGHFFRIQAANRLRSLITPGIITQSKTLIFCHPSVLELFLSASAPFG